MRFVGHESLIQSVAFSPDGRSVISGSGWDIDEKGFSAGKDNTIRLWDVSTGRERQRFLGHENFVYGVAFSPDGRWVLSGGGGTIEGHNNWQRGTDMSLRLWDVGSGREVHRFTGHSAPVKSVAFSPDGKFALSGSEDGTARVWRLPESIESDGGVASRLDMSEGRDRTDSSIPAPVPIGGSDIQKVEDIPIEFDHPSDLDKFKVEGENYGRRSLARGYLRVRSGNSDKHRLVYREKFSAIESVTILGGISGGRSFRIGVGPIWAILNWETRPENLIRNEDNLTVITYFP
jgi:dipeptidyl aminopeptidase/acylaminoacyl peptidase